MASLFHPFARAFSAVGRGYRSWRREQLLPSVLVDLNRSLGEDVWIVPERDGGPVRRRRP